MQSLSDDLLLGVLEYLADPGDWARWSSTCRRFRYNVGAPLCLQLVQLEHRQRTNNQQYHDDTDDDSDTASFPCKHRLYLPQLIFVEFPDSKRLARSHQIDSLVVANNNTTINTATMAEEEEDMDHNASNNNKYRLFTYHTPTNARAYLGRNHENPNPLIIPQYLRNSNNIEQETHVHGLAFHVDNAVSPNFCFHSNQQHQYWILHPKEVEEEEEDADDREDRDCRYNIVTRQMHIVGNCSPSCPPIIHHPTALRLLAVDYHGNWFVHSKAAAHSNNINGGVVLVHDPQNRPPRNTYELQVWRTTTTTTTTAMINIQNQHTDDDDDDDDDDTNTPTQTQPSQRRLLPVIPIQPKPFLSHNGGWNIYEPNVWEYVLQTNVHNGMTRHGGGRSTSLYFHVWIQHSRLYIHAQYIVFPLSIPILQRDHPLALLAEQQRQQQSGGQNDAVDNDDDDDKGAKKKAHLFLCNVLWTLFSHDSPRWYAIRHYLSMAANELENLRQLTRRQVQRGLDPIANPVLPPPARVDDVDDARDDGSMGLTATHAANTWIVPPHHHVREQYFYQAVYVEDPDRPQLRPWNNVLNFEMVSDDDDDEATRLHPNAPNVAKNMNQPAWSIVFYA